MPEYIEIHVICVLLNNFFNNEHTVTKLGQWTCYTFCYIFYYKGVFEIHFSIKILSLKNNKIIKLKVNLLQQNSAVWEEYALIREISYTYHKFLANYSVPFPFMVCLQRETLGQSSSIAHLIQTWAFHELFDPKTVLT